MFHSPLSVSGSREITPHQHWQTVVHLVINASFLAFLPALKKESNLSALLCGNADWVHQ